MSNKFVIKKEQICQKIQNFKFHNSFNNYGWDPIQEYSRLWGSKSGMFFRMRCRWQRNNMAKIQNLKFHNSVNNLVETLPGSMHDFWELIWCVLSEEICMYVYVCFI